MLLGENIAVYLPSPTETPTVAPTIRKVLYSIILKDILSKSPERFMYSLDEVNLATRIFSFWQGKHIM